MGFSVLARCRSKEQSIYPAWGCHAPAVFPQCCEGAPTPLSHSLVEMDAVDLGESETDSIPHHASLTWAASSKVSCPELYQSSVLKMLTTFLFPEIVLHELNVLSAR